MRRITFVALLAVIGSSCSDDVSGPGGSKGLPGVPSLGDVLTLNVPRDVDNPCEASPDAREGEVIAVTSTAIIVVDTANPSGGLDDDEYADLGEQFDEWGYPVVTQYFGEPSDLDENERVIAFFTRAVNEYTQDGDDGFVFGLFWAGDLFPNTGSNNCPTSNEAEVLYLAVPDNSGASPVRAETIRNTAVATMGHELQHLVNASRRLFVSPTADAFEAIWLNEGLSHAAEELMFFERTAAGPGQNIDLDWLRDGPPCVSPAGVNATERVCAFNQFQGQNLIRFALFLEDPETDAASLLNTEGTLASRGSDWHFLRYAADRHGDNAELWWDLVNTDLRGLPNLTEALGTDPEVWIRDWSAAVYADDEASTDPDFQFPSWDLRNIYPGLQDRQTGEQLYPEYPLTTHELTDAEPVDLDLFGMATGYIHVEVPPTGSATVTVSSDGGAAPPAQLRLSAVDAESGEVTQYAGSDAAEVTLEGGTAGAIYVLAALNASTTPTSETPLRFESEGAGPALLASAASRQGALSSRGSGSSLALALNASAGPMPAVNHRLHIEFLERAQRNLSPRIAHARKVYHERQLNRD